MTPRLVAISDRQRASAAVTLARMRELGHLARPGSVVLQLRDRELGARERLAFGVAMQRVARETGQLFVVNDRVDLALLLAADGVHLGEASIDTSDARRLLGERAFVSRACHDPSRVESVDADAILLGPILEARKGRPALGVGALGLARRSAGGQGALLFALGGVGSADVAACLVAGADGVAAVGSILGDGDLAAFARALDIAR